MGCIETFLPICCALLFGSKNPPKLCASVPVWETPNRPPNIKCIVPAFFGDRFFEKEGGLLTHNPPAEKVGGLGVFLY
jgi:hypothetical protein